MCWITELNRNHNYKVTFHDNAEERGQILDNGGRWTEQAYIMNCKARSRCVHLDGNRVHFYFGKKDTNSRVTFVVDGVWCKVDNSENPGIPHLYDLLWDLNSEVAFCSNQALKDEIIARQDIRNISI